MIETDFMKLYEKLGTLNEKWRNIETEYDETGRIWFSDSAIQFKNFMQNLPSTGMKGIRLIVAPDLYLAANAEAFNHGTMEEIAKEHLFLDLPDSSKLEYATCGIPRCIDFEMGNFEIEELRQEAIANPDWDDIAHYINYDADKDYQGYLIADYGTFELTLTGFKSRECPEYKPTYRYATYFEDSEIYRVLKPLLKRIYIYGKN